MKCTNKGNRIDCREEKLSCKGCYYYKNIDDLDEDKANCEIHENTSYDLWWTCTSCGGENTEYNVADGQAVELECVHCGKKFNYYVSLS